MYYEFDYYFFVLAFGLLVLSAKASIRIPYIPVPVTLQTLIVHSNIGLFGPLLSEVVICFYVMLIILCGVPIGASNAKDTQGYLFGFVTATFVENLVISQTSPLLTILGAFLLGDAIILAMGAVYYKKKHPDAPVFKLCVRPFIPGDILKCTVAAGVSFMFLEANKK